MSQDFDGDGTVDMDEFIEGCTHVHGNARSLEREIAPRFRA